jgi:hypothetical protein
MKPDLYIDIDGVLLLFNPQKKYEETPNTWLFNYIFNNRDRFDRIFWLSAWTCRGTLDNLQGCYPEFLEIDATPLKWLHNKTEAIDWSHPFIWLDDQPSKEELEIFNARAKFGQQFWQIHNQWR